MTAFSACSPNLLHLDVRFDLDLASCRFPCLKGFSIPRNVAFTAQISSFLQHHPTLETLRLLSTTIDYHVVTPIPLPHLQLFEGTNRIVDNLIFGSSIADTRIYWESGINTTAIENTLSALSLSGKSIQLFRSVHIDHHPQLLGILFRFLPCIVVLILDFKNYYPNVGILALPLFRFLLLWILSDIARDRTMGLQIPGSPHD